MKIQVRYFASLRDALGPQEALELGDATTIGGLRDLLLKRGGRYAEVLAPHRAVRCALNQVMADASAVVDDGAEVAFFPPVTGG